jgi:alcohol dehydrogenase (cytochrome c)
MKTRSVSFLTAFLLTGAVSAATLDNSKLGQTPTDHWPSYNGDFTGQRYSTLNQINLQTVANLKQMWSYKIANAPTSRGEAGGIKATPLIVGGVMYFSVPDHVFALDAKTGRELWRYSWMDKGGHLIGNRGLGMHEGRLYFMAPDDIVIALDANTGKEIWKKQIADPRVNYYTNTAPLVVGNHVIIGVGGDAVDLECFITALDPRTGAVQWRWNVTPRAGEAGIETWPNEEAAAHGGGCTWMPGTYDKSTNLLYWGTGNTNPVYNGTGRPGMNKWTGSIVALNVDTGKLAWGHSVSPHDTHDWDNVETPVLVDTTIDGQPRKLVAQASRNGVFTVLDRVTGKYLVTKPFVPLKWFKEVDKDGSPIPLPEFDPQVAGSLNITSATNWPAPSYSQKTGLFYVNATEGNTVYYITDLNKKPMGYSGVTHAAGRSTRYLKAIDVKTGDIRWQREGGSGGILTTAGGLVFTGDGNGNIVGYRDTDGVPVWHVPGSVTNGAVTVMLDGKQYLFVGSGSAMNAYALN